MERLSGKKKDIKKECEKVKINIIGNFIGSDGYTAHSKGLANALYKQADCKIMTQLQQGWEGQVNDAEFDMITKAERKEDWNVIISIPHMWKMFLGTGKNACYCVWEGDKVPESWIDEFLNPKIDLILVPSEHTRRAIWNTYFDISIPYNLSGEDLKFWNKVKIVPHGIDRSKFYKTNQEKGDTFTFVCNKGWRGNLTDRGGVQYLLKAFAEEFSKDEKVKLRLKLNPAYINPQIVEQAFNYLGLPEDRPPIEIIPSLMNEKQLNEFYNSGDYFICPNRAESFGLPGLEAMGCGLANIQTNYGGQTDYMTDKNSLFVDYELGFSEEVPAYEGIKWATPKIESIRKQLRWAFENQDKIKEMGRQAEEDSKKFTWDLSAEKLYKYMMEN